MRIKFLVGLTIQAALVVVGVLFSGGNLVVLFDFLSLLLVIGLSLAIAFGSWPAKDVIRAFGAPSDKDATKRELERSALFFHSLRSWIYAASGLTVMIGIIFSLKYINEWEPDHIGPNVAISLLGIFYAFCLDTFIVLPLESLARRRMLEM